MTSPLSHHAGASPQVTRKYVDALIDLTGDAEPATLLRATDRSLRALVEPLPPHVLEVAEAKGKWSVAQVVKHLMEGEIVWGYRLRTALAQPGSSVPAWDQEAWADRLPVTADDVGILLDAFAALRTAHLRLLEVVGDSGAAGWITHAERGEEDVHHMARLQAGHDVAHLRQIERIVRAVAGPAEPR